MENFLAVYAQAISPYAIMGLVCGNLGGIYAIRKHYKDYGLLISIILIIGSALAGAAVAQHLNENWHYANIWLLGLIGLVVGVPVGAVLQTIDVLSPEFANKILTKYGNKVVDKI